MMLRDWECSSLSAIPPVHSSCCCRCATWIRAAAGMRAMCRRRWGSQTFLTPTTQSFSYAPCTLHPRQYCNLLAFRFIVYVSRSACAMALAQGLLLLPIQRNFTVHACFHHSQDVSPWKDACFSESTKRAASLLCSKAVPQTCMHAIAHHSDSPC